MNIIIPEFQVTAWYIPHRSYGEMVNIDTSDDDGLGIFACRQSLEYSSVENFFLDSGQPHTSKKLTQEWVLNLFENIGRTTLPILAPVSEGIFGGATYGLKVARSFGDVTVVWSPRLKDQSVEIQNLWMLIFNAGDE